MNKSAHTCEYGKQGAKSFKYIDLAVFTPPRIREFMDSSVHPRVNTCKYLCSYILTCVFTNKFFVQGKEVKKNEI